MASRRPRKTDDGGFRPADDTDALVTGTAILDVGRSDRAVLEAFEPSPAVRLAAEWGGLMDGRLELRADGAIAWVPGQYAQRFGFVEFLVPADEVVDIRVGERPTQRGGVEIGLTDERTFAVRVPDPDRWRAEFRRAHPA